MKNNNSINFAYTNDIYVSWRHRAARVGRDVRLRNNKKRIRERYELSSLVSAEMSCDLLTLTMEIASLDCWL